MRSRVRLGPFERPGASVASRTSPTQRTLAELRHRGYLAQVVEHWVPGARVRRDLFGFIDVLAVRAHEVLGVQACAGASVAARVAKITEHENLGQVREAGIRIMVWGWRKSAAGRWVLREVDLS